MFHFSCLINNRAVWINSIKHIQQIPSKPKFSRYKNHRASYLYKSALRTTSSTLLQLLQPLLHLLAPFSNLSMTRGKNQTVVEPDCSSNITYRMQQKLVRVGGQLHLSGKLKNPDMQCPTSRILQSQFDLSFKVYLR